MSTNLKATPTQRNGTLRLTRFCGPATLGSDRQCLQIMPTQENGCPANYALLSKDQALELASALIEFARDKRELEY